MSIPLPYLRKNGYKTLDSLYIICYSEVMGTVILEIPTKRPDWATPAKVLAMLRAGIRPGEIAKAIGVSPSRVTRLLAQARRDETKAKALPKGA